MAEGGDRDAQPGQAASFEGAAGAWRWDLSAGDVAGDARFAALLGLDPAAAAHGVPAEEIFARTYAADRLRFRIAVAGVAHGAEIFRRDFRVTSADGVRWLSARGRAENPPEGGRREFSGVLLDITEQKRLEERLRVAQTAGGVGTFEYVQGFGTATVSEQFCRLLGLHAADTLPVRTINAVVHPGDPPLIMNGEVAEVVASELRIRRADTGEERWIAVRGERRASDDIDGGLSFIGAIYDVTEAKRAEHQLRDLTRTLETRVAERTKERDQLWTGSKDLFAVVETNATFRAVNPAWTTTLGYAQDEVVGRSFRDLIHGEDLVLLTQRWSGLAPGEVLQDLDARMRCRDGGWRWVNWTVIPLEDAFYAIGRDVTERKQLEDQLRQSQKMEAVGQLTGGIAHDFNNMLTGVLGGLDMIRRRIASGRLEDVDRFLNGAVASAERAAALTHRLLAFSRRQSLDARPIDANALVRSMEDMLRRTLGEQVDLATALDPDVWTTLVDANQLESAILNLAINARDAMPAGGQLTIETGNVSVDAAMAAANAGLQAGDFVWLSVSDNGTGIPKEALERVFDPFFTTKPLGQGTGLGLSMVYGFAQQSGGHASVYSEVGRGTTVKLYLPRHVGSAETGRAASLDRQTPVGSGETVLLVEDDEAVRVLVRELLKELGYQPIEAAEPGQALEALGSDQPIDLLITDVGLPGLNGRQLAEMARRDRPDLPILFITGYAASAARRSEFLGEGMEMISKPFAIDALAQQVRRMLAG